MDIALQTFRNYMGTGSFLILFLLAVIYLFLFEDRKPRRVLFLYLPALILLLFFNPLFIKLYARLDGEETYFRVCWLLPYLIVLPYTAILIAERQGGKKTALAIAAAAMLFAVSGKPVYSNPLYSYAENIYHMPDSVVHICDAIKLPGGEVKAVFPEELLLYVRQYSSVVWMPYGRDIFLGTDDEIYDIIESDEIDLERLLKLTRQSGCHYIVFREDAEFVNEHALKELELFFETDGYIVYRDNAVAFVMPETP